MEEGSLRCDVNVSVRPRGATELGARTEIKNLNSFRFVEKAIVYEVNRQIEEVAAGRRIAQETHLWDPEREVTRPMRSKEFANDYRYFPEPDLPPLIVPADLVESIRAAMPEMPVERRARYIDEFGLSAYEAAVLTAETREVAKYFEAMLTPGLSNRKSAANWVMTEVLRAANEIGQAARRGSSQAAGDWRTAEDGREITRSASTPRRPRSPRCAVRARVRRQPSQNSA